MERGRFMKLKIYYLFSAMRICGNIQVIVTNTKQCIKKLTDGIWLEKPAFCKRGRMQTGYGKNAAWHTTAYGFQAKYRGKP